MLVKLRVRPISVVLATVVLSLAGEGAHIAIARVAQTKARGQVTEKRLANADSEPGQWFATGRNSGNAHYSPLTQINKSNVARLGLAWDYDTHTIRSLEATPIVVDGVMYTSGSVGQVYTLDAETGKELWTFDPKNDLRVNQRACCDEVNRGVAVWKGKV